MSGVYLSVIFYITEFLKFWVRGAPPPPPHPPAGAQPQTLLTCFAQSLLALDWMFGVIHDYWRKFGKSKLEKKSINAYVQKTYYGMK